MTIVRIENVTVEKSYAYTFDSNHIKDVIFKERSDEGVLIYQPKRATLVTLAERPNEAPCLEELTFNRDYRDPKDLVADLNYYNHITQSCFKKYHYQMFERYPFVPMHEKHHMSPYRYITLDMVEEHTKNSLFFLVDFEVSMLVAKKGRVVDESFMAGTIQIHGRVE